MGASANLRLPEAVPVAPCMYATEAVRCATPASGAFVTLFETDGKLSVVIASTCSKHRAGTESIMIEHAVADGVWTEVKHIPNTIDMFLEAVGEEDTSVMILGRIGDVAGLAQAAKATQFRSGS